MPFTREGHKALDLLHKPDPDWRAKADALRAADEATLQAFRAALCEGASYAEAYDKGTAVFRAALPKSTIQQGETSCPK